MDDSIIIFLEIDSTPKTYRLKTKALFQSYTFRFAFFKLLGLALAIDTIYLVQLVATT